MTRQSELVSLVLRGNALKASLTVQPGAAIGPNRWVGTVRTDRIHRPVYAWTLKGCKRKGKKRMREILRDERRT